MRYFFACLAICIVFVLTFTEMSLGYLSDKTQAQKSESDCNKMENLISIIGDSQSLRAENPFFLSVKINNKTNMKLPLQEGAFIGLVLQPSLKTKGDIENESYSGTFSLFVSEKKLYSKIIEKDELEPNEEYFFVSDITKLKWGKSNSSVSPSENISTITKGDYEMYLSIEVTETKEIPRKIFRSNRISLKIE